MITYLKDKNYKSKKIYKKHKMLTILLKSIDTFLVIATTSGFITLSVATVGFTAIPISGATADRLSIGNRIFHGMVMQKYITYKAR